MLEMKAIKKPILNPSKCPTIEISGIARVVVIKDKKISNK